MQRESWDCFRVFGVGVRLLLLLLRRLNQLLLQLQLLLLQLWWPASLHACLLHRIGHIYSSLYYFILDYWLQILLYFFILYLFLSLFSLTKSTSYHCFESQSVTLASRSNFCFFCLYMKHYVGNNNIFIIIIPTVLTRTIHTPASSCTTEIGNGTAAEKVKKEIEEARSK